MSPQAWVGFLQKGLFMANWLYRDPGSTRASVVLLLVRLVMGTAFILHGWPKIQKPLEWMGPDAPVPDLLQAMAAVAEFGGGIALLVGVLTPLAALGLAITMAAAAGMVHIPAGHPFVGQGGPSWELAAVYFVLAIMFLLLGPGRFSLDAVLFGPRYAAGKS
jgi:putative oxidoreductase